MVHECPRCRKQVPAEARFCRRCGIHLRNAPAPTPAPVRTARPARPTPSSGKGGWVIFVLVALAVTSALRFAASRPAKPVQPQRYYFPSSPAPSFPSPNVTMPEWPTTPTPTPLIPQQSYPGVRPWQNPATPFDRARPAPGRPAYPSPYTTPSPYAPSPRSPSSTPGPGPSSPRR